MSPRGLLVPCLAAVLLAGGASCASGEDYPSRAVTIIVPFTPAGSTDILARMAAQAWEQRFGKSFVVENRPGAGQQIGVNAVAKAPPDGYTLLMATSSAMGVNPTLYKKIAYDPVKDFQPIAMVAHLPFILVVNNDLPVKSVADLVKYAKANPGKLSYGSAGVGSASHLAAELLKSKAGIEMVHVPNKGMNPALIDLMGGQVQVLFASVPGLTSEKSERVRPIAMAELKRSGLMPDLPTMNESGLPGFAVGNWAGLLGPAGLDAAIVKKLHDEVLAVLATPEMKERVKKLGYDLIASTPQEFAKQLQEDVERWGPVAQAASAEKK